MAVVHPFPNSPCYRLQKVLKIHLPDPVKFFPSLTADHGGDVKVRRMGNWGKEDKRPNPEEDKETRENWKSVFHCRLWQLCVQESVTKPASHWSICLNFVCDSLGHLPSLP